MKRYGFSGESIPMLIINSGEHRASKASEKIEEEFFSYIKTNVVSFKIRVEYLFKTKLSP